MTANSEDDRILSPLGDVLRVDDERLVVLLERMATGEATEDELDELAWLAERSAEVREMVHLMAPETTRFTALSALSVLSRTFDLGSAPSDHSDDGLDPDPVEWEEKRPRGGADRPKIAPKKAETRLEPDPVPKLAQVPPLDSQSNNSSLPQPAAPTIAQPNVPPMRQPTAPPKPQSRPLLRSKRPYVIAGGIGVALAAAWLIFLLVPATFDSFPQYAVELSTQSQRVRGGEAASAAGPEITASSEDRVTVTVRPETASPVATRGAVYSWNPQDPRNSTTFAVHMQPIGDSGALQAVLSGDTVGDLPRIQLVVVVAPEQMWSDEVAARVAAGEQIDHWRRNVFAVVRSP